MANISGFDAKLVQSQCNGMLSPVVYEVIYKVAKSAPTPDIVEVGAAHAAGTVSLASGVRDSHGTGTVYSFEKVIGGSREAFGDMNENLRIINANLAKFNVTDIVKLIVGDVVDLAGEVPKDTKLGLLCLDADGAIDRDFRLFFPRLVTGAPIVIDDVLDTTRIKRLGRTGLCSRLRVDQKHRLTYRLLRLFQRYNLVNEGEMCGPYTWLGKKETGKIEDVPVEEILNVYRSLTFTDATLSGIPMRSDVANVLKKILPLKAVEWLKRMERGDRTRISK